MKLFTNFVVLQANNTCVAKLLYSRRCDTSVVDSFGRNAVHIATEHSHVDMLDWLCKLSTHDFVILCILY